MCIGFETRHKSLLCTSSLPVQRTPDWNWRGRMLYRTWLWLTLLWSFFFLPASLHSFFVDAHFIEWRRTIRSCLIAWRSLRYGKNKQTQRIQTLFLFSDPFWWWTLLSSFWVRPYQLTPFPPKGSKGPTRAFCWLSIDCPPKKKRIVQSWRGIGLYPDERLKKKAMCAPPFLERWFQRAFVAKS